MMKGVYLFGNNVLCRVSYIFCLLFIYLAGYSQNSFIQLEKSSFQKGDTISFHCNLANFKEENIHFSTLYLFVEQPQTLKSWVFRYPMVDGIAEANLAIDSMMAEGTYVFNFLVRKSFFNISGYAEDFDNGELSCMMLTKNGSILTNTITTDQNGSFFLKGMLYEDTALFIFNQLQKKNTLPINVHLTTSLDSNFLPNLKYVQFITVGTPSAVSTIDTNYKTDINAFIARTSLPEVIVYSKRKKKIEMFADEYSSGLFKNGNARVFDGLEDNQLSMSFSIFRYLQGKVAGLRVTQNRGVTVLNWGGPVNFSNSANVDVFLDEFRVNPEQLYEQFINPADVAMIKVFPPPAFLSAGGQNAAIAVYTKKGSYQDADAKNNKFKIFGYTPLETTWK